jgi:hypothetical protein
MEERKFKCVLIAQYILLNICGIVAYKLDFKTMKLSRRPFLFKIIAIGLSLVLYWLNCSILESYPPIKNLITLIVVYFNHCCFATYTLFCMIFGVLSEQPLEIMKALDNVSKEIKCLGLKNFEYTRYLRSFTLMFFALELIVILALFSYNWSSKSLGTWSQNLYLISIFFISARLFFKTRVGSLAFLM